MLRRLRCAPPETTPGAPSFAVLLDRPRLIGQVPGPADSVDKGRAAQRRPSSLVVLSESLVRGPNGGFIVAIEFSPGLLDLLGLVESAPAAPARPSPLDMPPRKAVLDKQEGPRSANRKALHHRNSIPGSHRGRSRKSGR